MRHVGFGQTSGICENTTYKNTPLLTTDAACTHTAILVNPSLDHSLSPTLTPSPSPLLQDDILLPTTTPREALQFAAALRLPTPYHTQQQQEAAVLRLIDGMKLENCADTLVRRTGEEGAGWRAGKEGEMLSCKPDRQQEVHVCCTSCSVLMHNSQHNASYPTLVAPLVCVFTGWRCHCRHEGSVWW